MIERATDPTASRTDWHPTPPSHAVPIVAPVPRDLRAGHRWPFISAQLGPAAGATAARLPNPGAR